KKSVHSPVCGPGPKHLERLQEDERQKEPGEQPEFQKAAADLEMVDVCRFQGRVVARVDARDTQSKGFGPAVLDLQPNRRDSPSRQRHSEETFALTVVKHRHTNGEFVIPLDLRAIQKSPFLRSRRVWHAEPT